MLDKYLDSTQKKWIAGLSAIGLGILQFPVLFSKIAVVASVISFLAPYTMVIGSITILGGIFVLLEETK